MTKGSKHTVKTRIKMSMNHWSKRGYSAPNKGRKFSKKIREKISKGHLGQIPWNKGKIGLQKHTEETKKIIAEFSRQRKQTREAKRKIGLAHKGMKFSAEAKRKMSISHLGKNKGKDSCNWKGGRALSNGYIRLLRPEHPFADSNGRIYEHRAIVENIIGRYLVRRESVHHINGDKIDNHPKNLMAFKNERTHQLFEKNRRIDQSDIIFDGRSLRHS